MAATENSEKLISVKDAWKLVSDVVKVELAPLFEKIANVESQLNTVQNLSADISDIKSVLGINQVTRIVETNNSTTGLQSSDELKSNSRGTITMHSSSKSIQTYKESHLKKRWPDNFNIQKLESGGYNASFRLPFGHLPLQVLIFVREDIKLHKAKNAWTPTRFRRGDDMSYDEREAEELYRKVRSVLNKITPQKFDTLVSQIMKLKIDTVERLQDVVELVFEKAVDEPNFSVVYALMCRELALIQVPVSNSTDDKKGVVNLRKLLVTRCQMEFEGLTINESERNQKVKEIKECTDQKKKKELQFKLEEYDKRLLMKSLGNIRFIGELFKQQMLTVKIMLRCLDNLLAIASEESLEGLCKLLTTVGKELESKQIDLTPIFNAMQEHVDKKQGKISNRVRFMLQDMIDLRKNKWAPRRQVCGLKTIDQINKEAENEQMYIIRDDGRGSKFGAQKSLNGDQLNEKEVQAQRPAFTLSQEQFERHVKNNLDEYLNDSSTVEKYIQDTQATVPPSYFSKMVTNGYNHVLERSSIARLSTGKLFAKIIKNGLLPLEDYCKGLGDLLREADDLTIDIPMIWTYLAEILVHLICEEALSIKRLHKSCELIIQQGHGTKLLGQLFKLVVSEKGPNFLTSIWRASGLSFEDFINISQVEFSTKDYKILQKYVDNNPNFCLSVLQTLVQKLDEPKGFLLSMCNQLHEDAIIFQDSYISSEANDDTAKQEGK